MSGFPIGISAQISVDDSQNANQLASILTGTSSCIIPINPIVSGYTSSNKSYGVFNKKTGSNFPFESGIILSTRQSIISEDKTIIGEVWNDEDIDLKQALGINYLTHNRTYLEF